MKGASRWLEASAAAEPAAATIAAARGSQRGRRLHRLDRFAQIDFRLVQIAALIEQFSQFVAGCRSGIPGKAQRLQQIILRPVEIPGLHGATARVGVRYLGRFVEWILQRIQEVLDRLPRLANVTQEPAVVVVDVRILRGNLECPPEIVLGLGVFLELGMNQAAHAESLNAFGIRLQGNAGFLERHRHVAGLIIGGSQLGMNLGAVFRVDRFGLRSLGLLDGGRPAARADAGAGAGVRHRRNRDPVKFLLGMRGERATRPQAKSQNPHFHSRATHALAS